MKKKTLFNLLAIATLTLPLTVYTFLMATFFRIKPDATVHGKIVETETIEVEEKYYIIALEDYVTFDGQVEKVGDTWGLRFHLEDIVKYKDGFFRYTQKEGEELKWHDVSRLTFEKELSYKIPLSIIITAVGVLIVALIVSKKMEWHKKKPRLAVLLALITGTMVLLGLNAIISNLLWVFVIATLSWGLYYIEYLIYENKIASKDAEDEMSELTRALVEARKSLR